MPLLASCCFILSLLDQRSLLTACVAAGCVRVCAWQEHGRGVHRARRPSGEGGARLAAHAASVSTARARKACKQRTLLRLADCPAPSRPSRRVATPSLSSLFLGLTRVSPLGRLFALSFPSVSWSPRRSQGEGRPDHRVHHHRQGGPQGRTDLHQLLPHRLRHGSVAHMPSRSCFLPPLFFSISFL